MTLTDLTSSSSSPGIPTDDLCLHAGHCVNVGNSHYCKCPPDYTGSYCDKQVDYCEDKPCRNGATCRGYVGGYQCDVRFAFLALRFNFLLSSQSLTLFCWLDVVPVYARLHRTEL